MVNDINSLLEDVKNGKPLSFESVYHLYFPLISSAVTKCIQAHKIPLYEYDDLCQEASLALYKAALAYDGTKGVSFGLYAQICIQNRIISYIRSNAKLAATDDTPYDFYCDMPENETPEKLLISKESLGELNKNIDNSLTDIEHSVFRLYLEDLSYEDISRALSIPKNSVDNAIGRIKAKLRRLL